MKLVMVIDNNNLCCFIAQTMVNQLKSNVDSRILPSAFSALQYLNESITNNKQCPWPDLILLDIVMPVIDGHLFLNEYEKFSKDVRSNTKVVMVSSAMRCDKIETYLKNGRINKFINKPLYIKHIQDIYDSFKTTNFS